MKSVTDIRNGLNRRLEQFIKTDRQNYLYYVPTELREELYHYQYTCSEYKYTLDQYTNSIIAFITYDKITHEKKVMSYAFLSDLTYSKNITKLLEDLYATGYCLSSLHQ